MASNRRVNTATIQIWGHEVGAVAWNEGCGIGEFEYDPSFLRHGLDLSPLMMPLRNGIFSFPALKRETFHGLPGLLADSLPDRYGNQLIDLWLAQQGRSPDGFSPVERLCYMGTRGMGALEFKPNLNPASGRSIPIEITSLSRLASEILHHRTQWAVNLKGDQEEAMNTIIRIGTSAGGNRAKAVIAWNPQTHEIRSGQVKAPQGFQPWILKFDGVNNASLGSPTGYGRVEYAYNKMALAAGIAMTECRLLEENGRAHFMTRRFDRDADGEKVHMQSLCAMGHYDYNASGQYGYEQAFSLVQQLHLGHETTRELYRRMVFNVLARNQDDHTRNIAFLMDRNGQWRLSPAFDVVWSYNPAGRWTNQHQMSLNSKLDGFTLDDLLAVASNFGIKKPKDIVRQVGNAVSGWDAFASEAGLDDAFKQEIGRSHRMGLVLNL
jgi:serine/threonine-protein kinase HipA